MSCPARCARRIRLPRSGAFERLHNASRDMERLCDELISHFRNLMLIKAMKAPGELLAYSDQEIERLREEAAGFTMPAISILPERDAGYSRAAAFRGVEAH